MKIRNSDIYFARGEQVSVTFSIYTTDGKPYIFPHFVDDLQGIVVFTVRPNIYTDIVLVKYIDLSQPVMYGNDIDYFEGGYAKFTSQEIVETGDIALDLTKGVHDVNNGNVLVYHSVYNDIDIYQHIGKNVNGQYKVMSYIPQIQIDIEYRDTINLDIKNYTYDLITYYGTELGDCATNSEFPLKNIRWKREIVGQHKFIVEDTNNR